MTEPVDINILSRIAAELVEHRLIAESFERLLAGHTYIEQRNRPLAATAVAKLLDTVLSKYKSEVDGLTTIAAKLRAAAGLDPRCSDETFIGWLREAAALRQAVRGGAVETSGA